MTNKEKIQNNNNELLECIEIAENLPDIVEITLQEKTVTPTEEKQVVVADTGYDALNKVTVNPIPSEYIIPGGTKDISTNGTYDISTFENVKVNVPIPEGYIIPEGEEEITDNGTYDISEYESVIVNVPIPEGYIIPSGETEIIENGSYDISEFESVKVNVPIPDGYVKPSGALSITTNGTKDVTTYASVNVNVEPKLQTKTVSPTTSQQNITPDNDYDGLSKVTVNAMPTATQATPSISVSSSGLITASSTQTAGYVANGTKSSTKQLTTQGAKTITPSTSSQTAVASGRYTTGAVTVAPIPSSYVKPTATKGATTYTPSTSNQTIASGTYLSGVQTIKGDANLKAENIKAGVSIFGVTGTHSGAEDLDAELTAQETKIAELSALLDAKASGGGSVEIGTFTVNGLVIPMSDETQYYKFPFVIGMTWGEYINSKMNLEIPYDQIGTQKFVDNNGYSGHMMSSGMMLNISLDGNSSVSLDDEIIDGYNYDTYYDSGSGGNPYE